MAIFLKPGGLAWRPGVYFSRRYTEPSENGYSLLRRAGRGETLEAAMLPTLTVPVDVALG
jgi:hypothetical protein